MIQIPTPEQKVILDSKSRVKLIHAGPGSGKTWLVAEIIREELENWSSSSAGVAALSFTHVGGKEIEKAVGFSLDHPHFVGTIDAFLFRYILRPFIHGCFPDIVEPHLVPAEWGVEHWENFGFDKSNRIVVNGTNINLFGCFYIGEEHGEPIIARKPHPKQQLQRVTNSYEERKIREGKKDLWKSTGGLSHSDAAFLASKILDQSRYREKIIAQIRNRFPFMIVDELQDTGYFLAKCIRLLLYEPGIRGVLVGDPDQAIYEFNGARPDLFEDFKSIKGIHVLTLSRSQRCSPSVIEAARYIKDTPGEVEPAENKNGKSFLLRSGDINKEIEWLVKAILEKDSEKNIKVVTRKNETIDEILGVRSFAPPKLGCPTLFHLQRSVVAFRQGRNVSAISAARTAIDMAVFKHEGVYDEVLTKWKINPKAWKALAIRCMLLANELDLSMNVYSWQQAAGKLIEDEIANFELDPRLELLPGKLKPKKLSDWDRCMSDYLPPKLKEGGLIHGIPIKTVHGVKGETHDVTVFVCPPADGNKCPSHLWWSLDEKDREEKRIAYVAMTRTQGDLYFCVSEDCYQRLIARRPEFVASFTSMTVQEFVLKHNQIDTAADPSDYI